MKIDVTEIIDRSRVGPLHIMIVVTGFLIMIMDGYDLVAMATTVPSVSQDWGLEPSEFAWALSAALVGVLFGSTGAGALGDIIGRRWTIVIMLLICGLSMCVTPMVRSMNELIALRFVTGIGVGGCIPVTLAYTLEFMPARVRNFLTAFMYSGAAMGTVVAGFAGPTLIDMGGWPSVFYFGGLVSLVLAVLAAVSLPESLRFLVNRGCVPAVAGALLSRVDGAFAHQSGFKYALGEVTHKGGPIRELFGGRQTAITVVVWVAFFGNQFLVFLLGLWMPTLFTQVGLPIDLALYVLALYAVGGVVGGALFGALGDRIAPTRVLIATYLLAAASVFALGLSVNSIPLLIAVAICTGFGVLGSSLLLGTMTTGLYPTRARSTGIGWALAIGRFGSISSPLIAGALLAQGFGTQVIFALGALPALLCAVSVFVLWRLTQPVSAG